MAESAAYAHLSFRLPDSFVEAYEERPVKWGFPVGGGNTLGELTYLSKYSRLKPDGTKERWHETCRRVVEGFYSILKDHCEANRTPWIENKAQLAAQDAYERMFTFKWTPPGRGIWMMGTKFVAEHGSAALQNCAFLSTGSVTPENPTEPFVRLMEMSMLGIGVGFDTEGAERIKIYDPYKQPPRMFVVPDSREGWCESVKLKLESFLLPDQHPVEFDYSEIRGAGEPIKGFGGVAAGPEPLRKLHESLDKLFIDRAGSMLTSRDIVDIMNLEGKCVVAGNVRRSAELALGRENDEEFLNLKNWEVNPERMGPDGWGNLSNNSIRATVGGAYDHLIPRIVQNGEPGLFYLDLARHYGRLADPRNDRDYRAMGANPCVEQTLEDKELCTLVETFPINCEDLDDYLKTLKSAYLYAKAVTLLPTHWPDSNEVMQRNRRIGTSASGIVQFAETHSWTELRQWLDAGYHAVIDRDVQYSEWLGVRESIKTTSVKPSGTVSILAGVTPGVHFPVASGEFYRRIRYRRGDDIIVTLMQAGYEVEADVMDPENTVVVKFPAIGPEVRSEREASVWEKMAMAALLQEWWADNQVSATFTFLPHEAGQIGPAIRAYDGKLKAMSFLPLDTGAYEQMPYEEVVDGEETEFEALFNSIERIDTNWLYNNGAEAEGERFCSNDTCEVNL